MGNKSYFENLDGLRAIAALSVAFFHIANWFHYPKTKFYNAVQVVFSFGGNGGKLGVTFFFILSGFLITFLMFKEQTKYGSINISSFYLRRVLRIWPLYYLTLLVGFVIYPFIMNLEGYPYNESASPFLYSIFATNFDHIYNGHPSIGILGVQWSVAVEEQFYLIWPILFFLFNDKRYFPYLLIILFISSEVFLHYTQDWSISYYHLLSNLRYLSFGAILAYITYLYSNKVVLFLNKITKKMNFFIYTFCLSLLLFQQKLPALYFLDLIVHFLPFFFFGFVIIEQNFSENSFLKISSFKPLNWLGKISYGIYLLHMIAVYFVLSMFSKNREFTLPFVLLTIALTIYISYLSYRYIENFFLLLKAKFSRT